MPLKKSSTGGRPSASKPASSQQQSRDELLRFVNAEAKRHFDLEIKDRSIHQEKGFVFKKDGNFGLPEEVAAVIKRQGWKDFAEHPINPIAPLVREFYANVVTGSQTFAMVRGVKVSFSASSINLHLGLAGYEDNFTDFVETVGSDELDRILRELTVEGTGWLPDRGEGVYLCPRPALKPNPKIWYHFIRTRLLPTTHIESVSKERMALLHFILEGKEVNVGKLIQREISTCAFKTKGCLYFPSLITDLCLRSGVDVNSNDEILANTAAISTIAIRRFSSEVPRGSATRAEPAPQAQGNLEGSIAQLGQQLEHFVAQQRRVWTFLKDAHTWQKRMFQLNFSKKLMNCPIFPDEVFSPFEPTPGEPSKEADTEADRDADQPHISEDGTDSDSLSAREETSSPKVSKKGKEKLPEYNNPMPESIPASLSPPKVPLVIPGKTRAAAQAAASKSTPSSPPANAPTAPQATKLGRKPRMSIKRKASSPPSPKLDTSSLKPMPKLKKKAHALQKRAKMSAASISHFYSSSSEEEDLTYSPADNGDNKDTNGDAEVEIIKEVQRGSPKSLQRRAQAAKRRPGLRSTS